MLVARYTLRAHRAAFLLGAGRRPTTCDGTPATASARLTTGNTLIWGTRQVALRLEGNLGKAAALAIAGSATTTTPP